MQGRTTTFITIVLCCLGAGHAFAFEVQEHAPAAAKRTALAEIDSRSSGIKLDSGNGGTFGSNAAAFQQPEAARAQNYEGAARLSYGGRLDKDVFWNITATSKQNAYNLRDTNDTTVRLRAKFRFSLD